MKTRKRIPKRKSVPRKGVVSRKRKTSGSATARLQFPFSAIVGQEEMKLALILNVIDPLIGGVLIMGHRGTGKSTAVRGLAELLPQIEVVSQCIYRCDPDDPAKLCEDCAQSGSSLKSERVSVRVVDLPLGATEDRVCGSIDLERAIKSGLKTFEPGILAHANRGFLYIDEVNLLEDHLVDILLDAAATGRNTVEREGISIDHPARFVLVGSGNPEEGELRPQLQDRFGFHVEVTTENNPDLRMKVVEQRIAFDHDPKAFLESVQRGQDRLRRQLNQAQSNVAKTELDRNLLRRIAELCSELKIDGHRGELTITRGARALAAFEERRQVGKEDVRRVAMMSLRHRMRRDPLEEAAGTSQINSALDRIFQDEESKYSNGDSDPTSGQQSNGGGVELRAPKAGASRTTRTMSTGPEGRRGSEGRSTLAAGFAADGRTLDLRIPGLDHKSVHSHSQKPIGSRRSFRRSGWLNGDRGRYQTAGSEKKSRVALDASLRAAAAKQVVVTEQAREFTIRSDALRYKVFKRKQGPLYIFTIDTSGSMARRRIVAAKRILFRLLKRSYVNRDRVSIISFSGTKAKILLPPSSSILRARRVLDAFVVGGGTPLSAGLNCSLELAKRVAKAHGLSTVLLFTDGGANVSLKRPHETDPVMRQRLIDDEIRSLSANFQRANINITVVNTQDQFRSDTRVEDLASVLNAPLVVSVEA